MKTFSETNEVFVFDPTTRPAPITLCVLSIPQWTVSYSDESTTAAGLQRHKVFLVYLGLSNYLFTALCILEMHINYYCTEVM